jgi:hypothetical protein
MIQETMIINSRYLDLAWRGKYVFTPGLYKSWFSFALKTKFPILKVIKFVLFFCRNFHKLDMVFIATL